jgi:protein-disulfide isomerase
MAHRSDNKRLARERLEAERAAREAAERRRRRLTIVAAVTALVVAVAGGIWWQTSRSAVSVADAGPSAPAQLAATGIEVGEADTPVLDLYSDFLCPHCQELDERIGTTIDDMVTAGEVRLVLHPVSYIDETESARSAAALACSADSESVLGFSRALFENVAGGFSTERLVEIATATGLGSEAVSCIRDGSQLSWAAEVDAAARERGVAGTPTIFVNGDELPITATETADAFRAAFEELAG